MDDDLAAPDDFSRIGDNRIINGDMRIDQRNNGASGTASGYTVDRWQYQGNPGWQSHMVAAMVARPALRFPYCLGVHVAVGYTR